MTSRREAPGPAPAEVADALRRAGVPEADIVGRRRAEYSSDASNYRVVPLVVVFPRHADEIAAVIAFFAAYRFYVS